jgi:multimeric flavodoxin WrbA
VPRLLVIHHSPTPVLADLTATVLAGARDDAIEGVEVLVVTALDFANGRADHRDLLAADGYLLGTSANFGYMSGALKHVFDSTFLQIGGALDDSGGAGGSAGGTAGGSTGGTAGRPFGLYVHGRYDAAGATRSVLAITGALGWKQGFGTLEVLGDLGEADREAGYELGGTIAALLAG